MVQSMQRRFDSQKRNKSLSSLNKLCFLLFIHWHSKKGKKAYIKPFLKLKVSACLLFILKIEVTSIIAIIINIIKISQVNDLEDNLGFAISNYP